METANIGKRSGSGGKKAPKTEAPKASKKGSVKSDKKSTELRQHIIKIADAQTGDKMVKQVREALETNALALSADEIGVWAALPKPQRGAITPLVIDNRWKPSRAIEFLNAEIDGKTKLDDLANLLVGGKTGLVKSAGLRMEFGSDEKGVSQVVIRLDSKA